MSIPEKRKQKGFALIEVMIAIFILAFGLLALAALLSQLSGSTTQSRYLGSEVMLASEKLEDLNQLDYKAYKLTALAAGGSLTANNANYFDQVQISSRSGMVSDPTGAAGAANDMLTFQRRWVIESDTPAPRVQRITVIVIPLTGTPVERAATFQTSTIRPCDSSGC
jgi:prepilin-type N-terminal cleavage/methylation domain-containing protein